MAVVRVAVADDSSFIRKAVTRILADDPRIEVVGAAASGEELIENLDVWQADVITLDLLMPGMGGLGALDLIRERRPTPVLVLSNHGQNDAPLAIEALHRGAVDIIDKQSYSLVDFRALGEVLSEKILQVSGLEMPPASAPQPPAVPVAAPAGEAAPAPTPTPGPYDLLVVGASTGGPVAVQRVLTDLGPNPRVPIVIVQHMPNGFTGPFADRLDGRLPFPVSEAKEGEELKPGNAYVAPAGIHLRVVRRQKGLAARLDENPVTSPHRPSVDELFLSAADALGSRTLALLLTGMGRDGADGMLVLKAAGGHTVVQDESTCVVFGMPRAAIERDAAREVLPLGEIGGRARRLLGDSS